MSLIKCPYCRIHNITTELVHYAEENTCKICYFENVSIRQLTCGHRLCSNCVDTMTTVTPNVEESSVESHGGRSSDYHSSTEHSIGHDIEYIMRDIPTDDDDDDTFIPETENISNNDDESNAVVLRLSVSPVNQPEVISIFDSSSDNDSDDDSDDDSVRFLFVRRPNGSIKTVG